MVAPQNSGSSAGKKDRREAARETARIEREAEKKRQRRNRVFLQGGIGVGVLAVIAIVVLVVVNSSSPASPGPNNMASGGIAFTSQSGAISPVTTGRAPTNGTLTPTKTSAGDSVAHIVTYVDWACPACKSFEASYIAKITALVVSGKATLEVHPIAILDRNYAGSRYSSRAANVAACVANFAPAKFLDAQAAFYEKQPTEGTPGLDNAAMLGLLSGAGITNPSLSECVNKESFKSWVEKVTTVTTSTKPLINAASGGFSTPTIVVNGKRWNNEGDFLTFVSQSAGSPAPTPSPSPTN